MALIDRNLMERVARMSDEDLYRLLEATERCAMCMTRSRRDVELMRLRCLRCELERRATERGIPHTGATV